MSDDSQFSPQLIPDLLLVCEVRHNPLSARLSPSEPYPQPVSIETAYLTDGAVLDRPVHYRIERRDNGNWAVIVTPVTKDELALAMPGMPIPQRIQWDSYRIAIEIPPGDDTNLEVAIAECVLANTIGARGPDETFEIGDTSIVMHMEFDSKTQQMVMVMGPARSGEREILFSNWRHVGPLGHVTTYVTKVLCGGHHIECSKFEVPRRYLDNGYPMVRGLREVLRPDKNWYALAVEQDLEYWQATPDRRRVAKEMIDAASDASKRERESHALRGN